MAIFPFEGISPQIPKTAYIAPDATVIGRVALGEHVSIWPQAVVRGDVNWVEIGEGTNVQDGAVLHVTHAGPHTGAGYPLKIGRYVTIGHRAVVHGCRVGDHCLIGIGAIVMDGAVLESEVLLGAGAVVPPGKKLEGGHLYVGIPAKMSRPLTEEEKRFLRYSAEHYIQLKTRYLRT